MPTPRLTMSIGSARLNAPRLEGAGSLRVHQLPLIFHIRNRLDRDVREVAVYLLDLVDIDLLHNVAGLRIDRDRAARTFWVFPVLQHVHSGIAGVLAFLDRGEDGGHSVP